jgi:hypothetical protein
LVAALNFNLYYNVANEYYCHNLTSYLNPNRNLPQILEGNILECDERILKLDKILSGRQRSVDSVSSVNMMLIDTLEALELQPKTDQGKKR